MSDKAAITQARDLIEDRVMIELPDRLLEYRWRYSDHSVSGWRPASGRIVAAPPGACGAEWRGGQAKGPAPFLDWKQARAAVKPAHEVY